MPSPATPDLAALLTPADRRKVDDNRRWILAKLRKVADVACGGCTLCCKSGHKVFLYPEAGDEPEGYETVVEFDPHWFGDRSRLASRSDRSCVYLGSAGCTIHDRRPAACRSFSCVDQFLLFSSEDVRLLKRQGRWKPEHAEGQRRYQVAAKSG